MIEVAKKKRWTKEDEDFCMCSKLVFNNRESMEHTAQPYHILHHILLISSRYKRKK